MIRIVMTVLSLLAADEAALRETFSKEIQAEAAVQRVAAVKKLAGAREEKTILLLVASLKDKDLTVRKSAVETLEGSTDGGGVAIAPLGEILVDKKDDLDLRLACGKAMVKSPYKSEVFPFFLKTMSSIDSGEREFHKFGYDLTQLLDGYLGKHFGADKVTCERWEEWWSLHHEELQKADAKRHEEWKKAGN